MPQTQYLSVQRIRSNSVLWYRYLYWFTTGVSRWRGVLVRPGKWYFPIRTFLSRSRISFIQVRKWTTYFAFRPAQETPFMTSWNSWIVFTRQLSILLRSKGERLISWTSQFRSSPGEVWFSDLQKANNHGYPYPWFLLALNNKINIDVGGMIRKKLTEVTLRRITNHPLSSGQWTGKDLFYFHFSPSKSMNRIPVYYPYIKLRSLFTKRKNSTLPLSRSGV